MMSVAGFFFDERSRRSPGEFALNVIAVAAPVMLVLAYIDPNIFEYRGSILALIAITALSNWISGRTYLAEMNEEAPQDEEVNFWAIIIGVFVVLLPAFLFGAAALTKIG